MKKILCAVVVLFMGIVILSMQRDPDYTPISDEITTDSTLYFVYHQPPYSRCEDYMLQLTVRDGSIIDGYFWGTSDEFEGAREGYLPGFFVLRLQDIRNNDTGFTFVLNMENNKFFSGPVDVSIHSSEEALKHGYHIWRQDDYSASFPRKINYKVKYNNSDLAIRNISLAYYHDEDYHFVRIHRDSIENLNSFCDYDEENRKQVTTRE